MRKQLDYLSNTAAKPQESTLSSSHSSQLSSLASTYDHDTNLIEIIHNSKKYYLNPILTQLQYQSKLIQPQLNYETKSQSQQQHNYDIYYQREYEEINENTMSLKKQPQQISFNYSSSSSSASSTASNSQLIRPSIIMSPSELTTKTVLLTNDNNEFKRNQFQHKSLLQNSAFKPFQSSRQSLSVTNIKSCKTSQELNQQYIVPTKHQEQQQACLYYVC